MKAEQFATLSFLLFAFPLAFSEQVLDHYRKPVLPSREYYIMPVLPGPSGGGLSPNVTDSSFKCPVTVIQRFSENECGSPVKFTELGEHDISVKADTPLDIAFKEKANCATASNWVVVADDFPFRWIGIGTPNDHPGKKVINGSFKILKKYMVGYQLAFCPAHGTMCSLVGKTRDLFGYRLVLTDRPLQVAFFPAHV
ncbi:hypothetical protein Fmac_015681 [Flemingia macrophylla]|uniref:Uncharacterized protein n=1 Tax=Flemingia macrophylla TaxID=520843 RepID=A0ABD1MF88_9FABA